MNDQKLIQNLAAAESSAPQAHNFTTQLLMRFPRGAHVSVGVRPTALGHHSYHSGDMALCKRDVEEWSRWRRSCRFQILPLSGEVIRRVGEQHDLQCAALEPVHLLRDQTAALLFQALEAEESQDQPIDALFSESVQLALVVTLMRTCAKLRTKRIPAQRGLTPYQLRRALEYIDANLENTLSLSRIAAEVRLSPVYFAQRFRCSIGMPPHAYVLDRRVEKGKTLLREGSRYSVLDVALACGFKTQQHFARVFRRYTSLCPTAFMRSR